MQMALTSTSAEEVPPSEVALPSSLVGQILGGRYRVVSRIGAGGMGEVYRVEHRLLSCQMALKTLSPSLRDTPSAVHRFRQEAELGALLDHPNLVRVFDFELAGPTPYLVMELLEGRDLKSLLAAEGTLPVGRAVRLISDALAGIAAAHARGILHRDLKPANLFVQGVEPSERCRVLDFGVAKRMGQAAAIASDALTISGKLLGTLAYMPPEQLRGPRDVDARADVYSIAAMLFEMISGRRLVEAESPPEQMFRVLHERAPRLDELGCDCPRDLADIVERGLASDREERFEGAAQLAAALEPFQGLDRKLVAVIERTRPRRRRSFGLAGLAGGVGLGAVAGLMLGISLRTQRETPVQIISVPASAPVPAVPTTPQVAVSALVSAAVPSVPEATVPAPRKMGGASRTAKSTPDHPAPWPSAVAPATKPTIDVERGNPYQ
jgi:hypothetical protein